MPRTNYDKFPSVKVPEGPAAGPRIWAGAAAVEELAAQSASRSVAVDCYPGVDVEALADALYAALPGVPVINLEERAAHTPEALHEMFAEQLTGDRVFGRRQPGELSSLYRPEELQQVRQEAAAAPRTVVVGWGASLVAPAGSLTVLADLPRWEIQRRFREGMGNWRAGNGDEEALRKFKRGYFIEWRIADAHKRPLLREADFLLDTTTDRWKLVTQEALRAGLTEVAQRPFRVVPYFDPGPWGGTWMEEVCDLPPLEDKNYAWCFDCVPEENSLLLDIDGEQVEIPSIDAVLDQPRSMLGELTFSRFGAEFPIRFDFLDTMGGGNLSLQVHPLTDYIQRTFGMSYTQDESYYLLDAEPGAQVYLGLRSDSDSEEMAGELRRAETGETSFDAERFTNIVPAKKHDHFLIPAGTVHASGAGSMVLEISATPYIFTFKLWDWGRLGLDGRPRPVHIDHGLANIQWDRDEDWAAQSAVNVVEEVGSGPGWSEERTGLHPLEFIETRRHWFTEAVEHDTHGTVAVMNLVEGDEVVVESPEGAFEDFVVRYAETFIVPADVGRYRIRPHGTSERYGTIKAYVRGTEAY